MLSNRKNLLPYLERLRNIDIVGVTEKELGKGLFDRLKRIALLRQGLNDAGLELPIHIWGGLDPVTTPIYFFAGADIFDGISWLRYSFHGGRATNLECSPILDQMVAAPKDHAWGLAVYRNINYLQDLGISLRSFEDFGDERFDVFEFNQDEFRKAYATMHTKIRPLSNSR